MINTPLSYDDISLVPKYFDGESRSNILTDVSLGNHTFKLPVVPANMKCVLNFEKAEWLAKNGYFYIMHRFEPYDKIVWWVKDMNKKNLMTSISVGVSEKDKNILKPYVGMKIKLDYLTIDIAHGHCRKMKEMLEYIKNLFPNPPFIIAGNVMTPEAVIDLKSWGADCVKVGIGPGAACTTKLKTGFHSPMFSTVRDCSDIKPTHEQLLKASEKLQKDYRMWNPMESRPNTSIEDYVSDNIVDMTTVPIIADGGVRHNGDIFKSLVGGAKMVMVGSMFSSCVDSPATDVHNEDGVLIGKEYYGSASEHNKGHKRNIEGTLIRLKCNGMTYDEKLNEIKEDLQSSMSYSGISKLSMSGKTKFLITK